MTWGDRSTTDQHAGSTHRGRFIVSRFLATGLRGLLYRGADCFSWGSLRTETGMSKYHPLDVRHPDNRARERKSFLLDPPSESTYALKPLRELVSAPSRRSRSTARQDTAPAEPQLGAVSPGGNDPAPRAPWGNASGSSRDAAPAQNVSEPPTPRLTRRQSPMQQPRKRGGRWLWTLIYMSIIAYFLLRNTQLGFQIERFIVGILWDLGLM
tara:strand:- start:683 stop:1315 length:633 start_codon:yes stop_codon:yes gene_type:complete